DCEEPHRITMTPGDPFGPGTELITGPLEPVVGMTQLLCPDVLPGEIVLPIWGGQDDGSRPGKLEDGAFERRETRRVKVLDHLHDSSSVEPFQSLVSINQRPVE